MVAVCVGTGFPQPSISWSLDGSPLDNSSRVTIYEEVIEESGITFVQSFLEVCSVDFMDAGLYQCTVANRLVNASSNFTLTVSRVGGKDTNYVEFEGATSDSCKITCYKLFIDVHRATSVGSYSQC